MASRASSTTKPLVLSDTGATNSDTAPAPAPSSFIAFVLQRVAKNPLLINETAESLRPTTTASATASGECLVPSTLDAAQRELLVHAANLSDKTGTAPSPTRATKMKVNYNSHPNLTLSNTSVTALLQRALVDAPLLPLGRSHLLHEILWPAFVTCTEAAKEVGCHRAALQIRITQTAKTVAEVSSTQHPQQASPVLAITAAVLDDGVLPLTAAPSPAGGSAVLSGEENSQGVIGDSVFGSNPLTSSPSPGGMMSEAAATMVVVDPDALSRRFDAATLEARLAQAEVRLTESRRQLQRGFQRVRELVRHMETYDALPVSALRERRQVVAQTLFTPVQVAKEMAASAVPSSSPVIGDPVGVERKRPRED